MKKGTTYNSKRQIKKKKKIKRTHKALVEILRLPLPLKLFDPGDVLDTPYVMCSLDLRVILLIKEEVLCLHRPLIPAEGNSLSWVRY